MPEILTIVYLVYIFVALYFLSLFGIVFIQNRREIFSTPKTEKNYSMSVLIPAYNEQDSIKETIESVMKSNYKNLIEVIVIDDGSKDNTLKIATSLKDEYSKLIVLHKENSGKADSLNYALRMAKGELVAVVDADSYPDEHALSSMSGFFDDEKVGAVTTRILVKHKDNFLRKMQAVEYKVIAFTRKLLDFLDGIYVTPGPLALYRKSALVKIHGFDTKNMTEDIEATWHLVYDGYKVRMSFISKVTTVAPDTLKKWFKQRIRWNIGGYQTILKYKGSCFRKGMLGMFILPFFTISLFLGVFGLGILFYRTFRNFFYSYLSTKYSIIAETSLITMNDINLNPSILNFLGIVLFVLGMLFIFFALRIINKQINERESFFSVIFYSLIYATLRPVVLVWSLAKFMTGKYSWR